MVDIATLLQYLFEGDYLGFIQACYVSAFLSADIFYGMLILLFTVPLFIRTKSLLLLSIMWIMLGGLVVTAIPLVSGMAFLLMMFGIAGVLYKLYLSVKG